MPKVPPVATVFQGLGILGQLALASSALLTIGLIGWYAWRELERGHKLLPVAVVGLLGLSLTFLFIAPAGWAAVAYHAVAMIAILAIATKAWKVDSNWQHRFAWGVPAAALFAGELYLMAGTVAVALRASGAAINGVVFFNLGELLFVASGFALWVYFGRERIPLRARILPLLVALTFSLSFLLQPAMTGVMSIWSAGLSLYLPWPLYALSLYAALTAAVVQLRDRRPEGLGILLLIAAGFSPQLSHQYLMGLIGLIVISQPRADIEQPAPQLEPRAFPAEA